MRRRRRIIISIIIIIIRIKIRVTHLTLSSIIITEIIIIPLFPGITVSAIEWKRGGQGTQRRLHAG
jgi:hypothetical protein